MAVWKAPDGVGFIQLIDTFGSDLTVVNAARVSFAKEVTEMKLADEKLVKYLAEHDHVSPFFHPQAQFRIKMPIFVAREWFRHQIGFARNEVSRRYVDTVPECWLPSPSELRERDPQIKQGSKATSVDSSPALHESIREFNEGAIYLYQKLLAENVAPEIARTVLPQSMYTEFVETGSLAAYARLCGLRLGADAQAEIRSYACGLTSLLTGRFPISWEALQR